MASAPTGSIELRVDPAGLEATLAFVPNPKGGEWSVGRTMRLALDARLAGVAQKRVEEILAKFARASGPVSEVLVRGVPPDPPSLEDPEWVELPVPPEAEPFRDEVLREAPAPAVFRTRVEKISVEKVIRKPGALPFLPAKEERVVETEKREVREPVALDTRILKVGFARRGQRLALLSAAAPGKPGKTVYGKAVNPEGPEDTGFYCGEGVTRNRNELVAGAEGFVRIGSRWVDVRPFGLHSWEIARSADGTSFLLNFTPGDVRLALPKAEEILTAAEGLGADRASLVSPEDIARAMRSAVADAEPLLSYSISESRDASVEITVSPDKMSAAVTVRKGRGRGRPLELPALGTAIARAKIVGMDTAKVKKDLLEFFKGPDTELSDYVLATGRPPGRGKDRELAWSVAFLPEDQAEPLRRAAAGHPALASSVPSLGDFPLAEAAGVCFVQAGQEIGKFTAPSPGTPGQSVLGEALPGIPGADPKVSTFENVARIRDVFRSEVEGLALQGERDGEFFLRVIPYKEYLLEVSLAPDISEARLSLRPAEGLAPPPTVESVLAALAEAEVTYGIDRDAVSATVLESLEGRPAEGIVVARRKDPVTAGGVRVEWKVRKATGAAVTIREDGRADYKNQDRSTLVTEGQPLAELVRFGGEGEDGIDVRGQAIKAPADPRSAPPPQWDASVREERTPEGNVLLVAARTGELYFEGNRLSIVQGKQVAGDVGPATGNVRFPGAVQVSGSVLGGYTVFAEGDVAISGSVEAALISSDGSIRIGEGIKGRRKATLRARKTLEAAFAEQALLLAVEGVSLRGACLLSNVKTNGRLVLGGDKGILIGGIVRARRGVEVQSLGSENGIKTEVSFGQDYLLADQAEAEEREIERLKALILQTDKRMKDLERSGFSLDEVRQDKTKLVKLIEKRSLRIFDLRERFEEHHESTVTVRGVVHPGVILESHNRFLEIQSRKERVVFTFDVRLGRIVEQPLK